MIAEISISIDHDESVQFVNWLNANGYDAKIGVNSGNYVGSVCTSHDEDANRLLNNLWENYCRS